MNQAGEGHKLSLFMLPLARVMSNILFRECLYLKKQCIQSDWYGLGESVLFTLSPCHTSMFDGLSYYFTCVPRGRLPSLFSSAI
jgi:hypothetical protein